jgi:hypothetical protein
LVITKDLWDMSKPGCEPFSGEGARETTRGVAPCQGDTGRDLECDPWVNDSQRLQA